MKSSTQDFLMRNMTFSLRLCPVCSSNSFESLYKGDRHNLGINNVICQQCHHIYVNPSPDQDSLNLFYQNYYRELYNSSRLPDKSYLVSHHPLRIGTTRSVADILYIYSSLNNFELPKSIFDLGCAEGYFLSVFHRLCPGIIRDGLDLNSEFLSFGKGEGWIDESFNMGIETFNFERNYDLVTSLHVIEHVVKPVDFLGKLKSGLNKGGIIFLEFPVGDRRKYGNYFHLAHVNHFTESSIRELFRIVGLNIYLLDREGSRGGVDGAYRVIAGVEDFTVPMYENVHPKTDYILLSKGFKKFRWKRRFYNSYLGRKLKNIFSLVR